MAVAVAGKVLTKEMNESDHRRLLDAAIKELPVASSSNGHGGKLMIYVRVFVRLHSPVLALADLGGKRS